MGNYPVLPTNNTRAAESLAGCSRSLRLFQLRFARSSGYLTEIISPANKQYKGRKSLAAVPEALRAFQKAGGRSKVPNGSSSASRVPGRAKALFQKA